MWNVCVHSFTMYPRTTRSHSASVMHVAGRAACEGRGGGCGPAVGRLSNFKLAALAVNRGPLTEPLSPAQFAVVLLAPITPQLRESSSASPLFVPAAAAAAASEDMWAGRPAFVKALGLDVRLQ